MIAFLYARVSTGDQNEGMQLEEMQEYARRRKWQMETFTDAGFSGSKASRPGLDQMMTLVRRRKCDVVLVYRYDRFARSLHHLVGALEEFRALDVNFVSLHEGVDTSTANGRLVFGIFASIAEFERELIRERTRSGMAQARRNGKQIGRPRVSLDAEKIALLRAQGHAWREIAHRVGADESTVRKFMRIKGVEKSEK